VFSGQGLLADAKLSAIGRAEFHPVDPARLELNRRIELILQYDRAGIAEAMLRSASRRP
jgi:hypothetical protein